ncbi:MAG: hypothetical protein HYW63_01970 [Candidatus Levybacteria bacterium]|nr:hypothetical protein [Candidatus Levybacteria bacterium]
MLRFLMLSRPKKVNKKLIIKNARNTSINPTTEATIVPLASSTFVLSPPERIQRIPPNIKNARAIKTAKMNANVTSFPINPPERVKLHSVPKPTPPPLTQGFTFVCAKTGEVMAKNEKIKNKKEEPAAISFLILNSIVEEFLRFVKERANS